MSRPAEFEVLDSGNNKPHVRFLSGQMDNLFKLDCNHLCILKGRLQLRNKEYIISENFECRFDTARSFNIINELSKEDLLRIPSYIEPARTVSLQATEFPANIPIQSMQILLVNGKFLPRSRRPGTDITHNIFIMKTIVQFKHQSQIITTSSSSSNILEEIHFDKMTLLRGRLTLPRPRGFNLDLYLDTTDSNSRNSSSNNYYTSTSIECRAFSPLSLRYKNHHHHSNNSSSSSIVLAVVASLWNRLSNHTGTNFSLEFFICFLVFLLWLIFRSYYITEDNHSLFTMYTVVFMTVTTIIIFSFRGLAMNCFYHIFSTPESNGRSFFVNGWNAWSYCGSVLQGQSAPMYAMPSVFVRAFHDGGEGCALRINMGQGDAPPRCSEVTGNASHNCSSVSSDTNNSECAQHHIPIITVEAPCTPTQRRRAHSRTSSAGVSAKDTYTDEAKDYIASDMFTALADTQHSYAVVMGFLSQKLQFGCIATNRGYDRISVYASGDGVVVPFEGTIESDWLMTYTVTSLENPFQLYMAASSAENRVHEKLGGVLAPLSLNRPTESTCGSPSTVVPTDTHALSSIDLAVDELYDDLDKGLFRRPSDITDVASASHSSRMGTKIPAGWCSWYHFYDKISEGVLTSNLLLMQRIREQSRLQYSQQGFELFQVDDGYQTAWGDWLLLDRAKFPTGSLSELIRRIRNAGLQAGLWMAPFSCDKHALIAKQHPEWILKRNGSTSVPCNSANCGKFFYGLDTTHPGVQKHIQECIEVATKLWGVGYLKLDFLYSAVLRDSQHSHFDRTLTSAQILSQAMALIESAAGEEVFVLGCGAPLGAMIGKVHANRVSADAGSTWNPSFPLPSSDKWNLPCARNCVRNTLNRLFMHQQWWINDPDCMMLRDGLQLSDMEIQGIATSKALSGGSFVLSDDLDKVSPQRLRIAQQLLPPAQEAAVAIDLLEKETPELFRTELCSNYLRLIHDTTEGLEGDYEEELAGVGIDFIPDSPITPSSPFGTLWKTPGTAPESSSAPARRAALSLDIDAILQSSAANSACSTCTAGTHKHGLRTSSLSMDETSGGLQRARSSGPLSSGWSLQLARKHSRERGLIFQAGSGVNLVHKERRKIRTFLKEENLIHENDLIGEYTLFTVCNWGESSWKNHFLSVRRVFGAEYIEQLLAKNVLLDNLVRVQLSRSSSGGNRTCRGGGSGLPSEPALQRNSSRNSPAKAVRGGSHSQLLASSPRYLMHIFNFWQEAYTYRVVSLDEEHSSSEVAFLHVPRHSAHIYAVSLTTDPTLPKYVGSNLHFTSGREVQRCFMSPATAVAEATLRAAVFAHVMALREEVSDCCLGTPCGQTYNSTRWQEEGGGNDFAFGFGFGDNGAGTLRENTSTSNSYYKQGVTEGTPNSRTLPGTNTPSSVIPVVRSMVISFEPGALKDPGWGGCVWVYLPVNGLNPAMAEWSLDKIHITGTAWRDKPSSRGALGRDHCADAALAEAVDAEEHSSESSSFLYTSALPSSRGNVSSEMLKAQQAEGAHLVARVIAPECKIYGSVFRIAVSCCAVEGGPSREPAAEEAMFFQDRSFYGSGGHGNGQSNDPSCNAGKRPGLSVRSIAIEDDTAAAQVGGAEYITVSWIYDVKDTMSTSLAR